MPARERPFGYAVHGAIVVLPLGLLGSSVVFDVVASLTHEDVWGVVAYWDLAAGILCGALAGAFGLVDLRWLPAGSRASRAGIAHAALNVAGLFLFGVGFMIRTLARSLLPGSAALACSLGGLAFAFASGWLGTALARGRRGLG
jgi:uncharacterized membrane protein